MASLVATLDARLRAAIVAALGSEYEGADPVLRASAQPQFGDFQANAAMALAKRAGRPPRDVAAAVVGALDVEDLCERVEVAGPGFINLTVSTAALSRAAADLAGDPRLGVASVAGTDRAERVVVDYSAPNVAKEMHVGHLRSTVIGDSLARVLGYLGHDVIRQNHIGDWGTPFGMLIEHLLDVGEDEAAGELSVGDLTGFYQAAREKFDGDPSFADRARQRVVLLQAGDEQTLRLWHLLVDESKRYFNAVYERLGVLLTDDDIAGESFYNPWLADVAAELERDGVARIDDGALCAFPPGFTSRDGNPLPLLIRKRDGGFGYQATDLAAIRHRTRTLGADRIVYVVGAPQATHLAMVFEVARAAGWLADDGTRPRAEHVPFGSVLGEDRKMLKTRAGESPKLVDLLDEAVERARAAVMERAAGLDEVTAHEVARAVGIGAVKYADLSVDRVKDYVFDWDRMLAFEGNTGPYLQYAHARIRSIFRRAAGVGEPGDAVPAGGSGGAADARREASASGPILVVEPAERALVLQLVGLGDAVEAVADSLQPHRLCGYLFDLAQAFTAFYETCPVLRASDEATRRSRLALCDLAASALALGLGLLGIEAPDRM